MRGKDLLLDLSYVDESLIESAAAEAAKSQRSVIRWAAAAACVCLAAVLAMMLPKPGNHVAGYPPTVIPAEISGSDGSRVIAGYSSEGSSAEACYKAPEPGEWFCFIDVNEAREAYKGQEVGFLLAFDIFSGDYPEASPLSEEGVKAEHLRLAELGYRLYEVDKWEYGEGGRRDTRKVVVGLFTEYELESFKANPSYGYGFHFIYNGDHSPLEFSEENAVKFYPSIYG